MFLTEKQKAFIENDYVEKKWNAHKIWTEHPSFECSRQTVHDLIKKIKESGSTNRKKGSGRRITATTEENDELVEELMKTPQLNTGCRQRRKEHASKLFNRFSIHSLPRLVFQDEKDFTLQVKSNRQNNRVYFDGHKKDVQPKRLLARITDNQ